MTEKQLERMEVNRKMIGKVVFANMGGDWNEVEIVDVVDPDTFLVRHGLTQQRVDIFDIRS